MTIKKCPFCGKNPILENTGTPEWPQWMVYCANGKCLIQPETYKYKTVKNATNAWDKRK